MLKNKKTFKIATILCTLAMVAQINVLAKYRANYTEGFNASLAGVTDGWTLTAAPSTADYAGVLTNHLQISKTSADAGYVEVSRTTSSFGLGFSYQLNMELDFYVTGTGQDTKIILPMDGSSYCILGFAIQDDGLYELNYNGSASGGKLCNIEKNKLYTLKIISKKTAAEAKLYIYSNGQVIYANDNFFVSANYGSFKKIVYRVAGANTSFNLKRFALDGRYDNYSTRFDYYESSVMPTSHTVVTNGLGNAAIAADPDFIKAKSSLALISGGSGTAVSAVKDLRAGLVSGNYIKYSAIFNASVDTNGVNIYLERGNGAGVSSGYLAWLKIVRASTGEDTTLTLQNRANWNTYNPIKTGITDLGRDHLLELYINSAGSVFDVYFDGELIGKNYPFYNGASTWKNVEFMSYSVANSSANSFVLKDQNLTILDAMPNNDITTIYDFKSPSLKGYLYYATGSTDSVNVYINNSKGTPTTASVMSGVYINGVLVDFKVHGSSTIGASSTGVLKFSYPYSTEAIAAYKTNFGGTEAKVKFFLWDGLENMIPLSDTLNIADNGFIQ